jgi:hypothetical protein
VVYARRVGRDEHEEITVQVSDADRAGLVAIVADRNSPQKHVWRAQIVLLTVDGVGTRVIMRRMGKSKVAVWRCYERFMTEGVAGLRRDKTRPSRIPRLPTAVHDRTVVITLTAPPAKVTHWTAAMMAKAPGISVSSGLQPHRLRQFKLSCDPQFAAKLRDIVGLYVDPHAVVLSLDEKSQIQCFIARNRGLAEPTSPVERCAKSVG